MADEKITISWDDLQSRKVDNRLREQQAVARNREYAQMKEDALPVATAPAKPGIWTNSIFQMAVFGLVGGLLAWLAGAVVVAPLMTHLGAALDYRPGDRVESDGMLADIRQLEDARAIGKLSDEQAQGAIAEVRRAGRRNPYFQLATATELTEAQRQARARDIEAANHHALFVIDVVSFGICGMMLAMCLTAAEPLTQRKTTATVRCGAAGALLGLVGGAAAALLAQRVETFAGPGAQADRGWLSQLAIGSAEWGLMGLFLGLAPGLILRNGRKLLIGVCGGLLGGVIGGALFAPVLALTHQPQIARGLALLAIGVVAGLATGYLENAAKGGWLKVATGIIAGKQFILYRNPTYIGSAPDCQIYLFKDPKVGKRHAAIHLLPTGIEIENLPLGAPTIVNDREVGRARIKNGDRITIGSTCFHFLEKRPAAGKK
ncbi:MAG: hypothetical protein JWP03_1150 [Phycisphaerales bacterium]|nr:hypothetical protein [Phycisphaerales bacterium]